MSFIYVILDFEDRVPVLTATTKEKVEELLHEYMGYNKDPQIQFAGFKPYDYNTYYEIYEGVYKYNKIDSNNLVDESYTFIRYCIPIDTLFN
jgi:hypothetical protein